MSNALTERTMPVVYGVNEQELALMRQECAGLKADTKDGYEKVRVAIGTLRTIRTSVETRRVELKRDALEWGRKVDAEAKRITALVEAIENPLKEEKARIDDAKERERKAKEEAERIAREQEEARKRDEEEARRRAEREEEEKRLAEERAKIEAEKAKLAEERRKQEEAAMIEREKLEAERRRIEDEARKEREKQAEIERFDRAKREAEAKAERDLMDAERRRLEEERMRLERIRIAQEAKERAEKEAREKVERERIEAERKAAAEKAEAERLAALAPDVDKIADMAKRLSAFAYPSVHSESAMGTIAFARNAVGEIVRDLQVWCDENKQKTKTKGTK